MDIGITIDNECLLKYEELRMKQKHRYIIYKTVNNSLIQIHKIGERNETLDDLINHLPENEACFCILDYHKVFPLGRVADKIVYIYWCPDNAPVKVKMVSATTNQQFQSKFQGIAVSIQANDVSSLTKEEVEAKIH